MSSLGKTGNARGKNAFVSGESSRIVDALPDMAEWFEKDAAAERALPRVVGKLPDLGLRQPPKRKPKRFSFGKFVKKTAKLTLTFLLGAGSAYHSDDLLKVASNEGEEAAATSSVAENVVADSNDWPDLDALASDANSMFAPFDFDSSASSQPKGGALYSGFDDFGFTESASATSPVNGAWSSLAPVASLSAPSTQERDDALAPSYSDDYDAQDAALVAAIDASSPATSNGGFAGFQGYEFNQDAAEEPFATTEEEAAPTNMAENERDRFLANANPNLNGNDFNNNAEFKDYAKIPQQNIAINNANQMTSPQNFDYNSQNGYNGNQFAAARPESSSNSNRAESRFAGFGSSWNAPGDNVDAVTSESPLLEDRFNGEYVAQTFDDPIVETTAPAQRPVRSLRW